MGGLALRYFVTLMLAGLVATPVAAGNTDWRGLVYSPWIKFCLSETCFIGRDGSANADCGPVVAVVLVERNGDAKKTLRVTLPTRVNRERGVRITIDRSTPVERPYINCYANGCTADYDAGPELLDQLKQGQTLRLEAVDKTNSPISLAVPLAGFADAYDGAPQEPKVFEEIVSTKEQEEASERRRAAEEDRKARCEAR
jgi:invasion protein IalB